MQVTAWAKLVLNFAQFLEWLGEVFSDRAKVTFAAFHSADAVCVVVAQAVHQWQLDTGAFHQGLAVFLA